MHRYGKADRERERERANKEYERSAYNRMKESGDLENLKLQAGVVVASLPGVSDWLHWTILWLSSIGVLVVTPGGVRLVTWAMLAVIN